MRRESWAAVPTRLMTRPEYRALSSDAKQLWLACRLHAAEVESDGMIEDDELPRLVLLARVTTAPDVLFAELVTYGWWQHIDGGWLDVQFLDVNTSHAKREQRRESILRRVDRYRDKQASKVTSVHETPLQATPKRSYRVSGNAVKSGSVTPFITGRGRGTGTGTDEGSTGAYAPRHASERKVSQRTQQNGSTNALLRPVKTRTS